MSLETNQDPNMPDGLDEALDAIRQWERRVRRRLLVALVFIAFALLLYLLL